MRRAKCFRKWKMNGRPLLTGLPAVGKWAAGSPPDEVFVCTIRAFSGGWNTPVQEEEEPFLLLGMDGFRPHRADAAKNKGRA